MADNEDDLVDYDEEEVRLIHITTTDTTSCICCCLNL